MSFSVPDLLAALPDRLIAIPRRWQKERPDARAILDRGIWWTFADLGRAVDEAKALLIAHNVRPGDRVMIIGENCAAQVALIFAIAEIDAWSVSVNARLSAAEVDNIRTHCGARRVIYTIAVSPDAKDHATEAKATHLASPLLGELAISPLNESCTPEPVEADGGKQVAALIYTTGTTGHPKGVMLTHRNLLFISNISSRLRGLTANDLVYGVLPISHVYGLASVMLGTLNGGASIEMVARYTPQALLKSIEHTDLTILQGVPAMYARLLEFVGPDWQPPGNQLRFMYAGGSPLDPTLKTAVEARFKVPLHNGYGMTESSPTISQTRPEAPRDDTSVGYVIPGIEVRIVDKDGHDLPDGEPGECWVRGPNIMKGYYREPELTAATMREGDWLNTGDIVRRDPDGALFIVGRTKELIIRSGFNVYPVEVEAAINAHPAVTQSAVVGRQAEDGNEEVVAYIELDAKHTLEPAALQAFLAERLSPYKVPSRIIIMKALPAAATGKILKGKLKDAAQKLV